MVYSHIFSEKSCVHIKYEKYMGRGLVLDCLDHKNIVQNADMMSTFIHSTEKIIDTD